MHIPAKRPFIARSATLQYVAVVQKAIIEGMPENLIVAESVWSEQLDEDLMWHTYDPDDSNSFPIDASQVWVAFDNGRSGPATFNSSAEGHFSCFNAPWGALIDSKPVRWAYKHWNVMQSQLDGADSRIEIQTRIDKQLGVLYVYASNPTGKSLQIDVSMGGKGLSRLLNMNALRVAKILEHTRGWQAICNVPINLNTGEVGHNELWNNVVNISVTPRYAENVVPGWYSRAMKTTADL